MKLANIHCHMLYGVDDGAKDEKVMRRMIDASYADGVRLICFTPHHNPEYFRASLESVIRRYSEAVSYISEKYPDLIVCLGQEIYSHHDSLEELLSGKCLTLGKSKNVLLEFGPYDDKKLIFSRTTQLLTSGFIPLVAHAERYSSLRKSKKDIQELRDLGACIQVNAASIIGRYGFMTKRFVMSLIKDGLVDVVADDCHNLTNKAPCLREAHDIVLKKFGIDVASKLFFNNPVRMLKGGKWQKQ
ncbi:MAG: hypothetical protein E7578_05070 [Ruminococcaceae bacterium]|nr:hypothetical protein [Oscillospiraceae bacterium]